MVVGRFRTDQPLSSVTRLFHRVQHRSERIGHDRGESAKERYGQRPRRTGRQEARPVDADRHHIPAIRLPIHLHLHRNVT